MYHYEPDFELYLTNEPYLTNNVYLLQYLEQCSTEYYLNEGQQCSTVLFKCSPILY